MKEGFVPAEVETQNTRSIPSLVKTKAQDLADKHRSLENQPKGGTLSALTRVKIVNNEVDTVKHRSICEPKKLQYSDLETFPKLEKYDGRSVTADGRPMGVLGRARVRIQVGS